MAICLLSSDCAGFTKYPTGDPNAGKPYYICPPPNPCVHALWCYTFHLVAMTQDEYAVLGRQ